MVDLSSAVATLGATFKLAEFQVQIADLKLELQSKDERIRELEKKLAQRAQLVRHNEMYCMVGEDGKPTGDPYCPRCFEAEDKLIHLVHRNSEYVVCPACETTFPRNPGHESGAYGVTITPVRGSRRFDGY